MSWEAAASGITAVTRASASPSIALMPGEEGVCRCQRDDLHGVDI